MNLAFQANQITALECTTEFMFGKFWLSLDCSLKTGDGRPETEDGRLSVLAVEKSWNRFNGLSISNSARS